DLETCRLLAVVKGAGTTGGEEARTRRDRLHVLHLVGVSTSRVGLSASRCDHQGTRQQRRSHSKKRPNAHRQPPPNGPNEAASSCSARLSRLYLNAGPGSDCSEY